MFEWGDLRFHPLRILHHCRTYICQAVTTCSAVKKLFTEGFF